MCAISFALKQSNVRSNLTDSTFILVGEGWGVNVSNKVPHNNISLSLLRMSLNVEKGWTLAGSRSPAIFAADRKTSVR